MPLFRSIGARKDVTRGTTALEVRQGLAGLLASAGGIAARPGVFAGAPTLLVTGTAGWNYSVPAAHFAVSRGASDGVHIFGNDGATSIATGAAPGAGTSRIDIVWVRHPSNTENSDTNSVPVFGCSQSLASATPLAPSIPAGALELARNTMLSTATTTASAGNAIVQTFPWTALRGAPIPVRNQSERIALVSSEGLQAHRLDLQLIETFLGGVWSGGPWTPYTPAQTGIVIGNGSIEGAYQIIGKTLDLNIVFNYGSTSTFGAGDIVLYLPPGMTTGPRYQTMPAWMNKASTGSDYLGVGRIAPASTLLRIALNASLIASINASRPFVWANGDLIAVSGRLEIA